MEAEAKHKLSIVCRVRAHMALCYANVQAGEWDARTAGVFAANLAFVNMWHGMGRTAGADAGNLDTRDGLGFPEVDVFELVLVRRRFLCNAVVVHGLIM